LAKAKEIVSQLFWQQKAGPKIERQPTAANFILSP